MMDTFGQGRAIEIDDPLVTLRVLALIDSEGEVSGAEQAGHRVNRAGPSLQPRERLGIELSIAAHGTFGCHIGDHEPDRPIALGLQGEHALVFKRARQQHGERDGFAQHLGNRFGIVVATDDFIHGAAEPGKPAAQGGGVYLEGADEIVAVQAHVRHQNSTPFCACSRFSASSQTTDCGPSITSPVTSSPRFAGRQCMKIAPLAACAISASSTR